MPTLEILEEEMFWAQYDRPPPAADDGEIFPKASFRALDTTTDDSILSCSKAPSPTADSVVPQRAVGVLARWSRYLLGLRRARPPTSLAASAGAGGSTCH